MRLLMHVITKCASGVMFDIYVELPRGNTIWLIQSNPANDGSDRQCAIHAAGTVRSARE